MTSSVYSDIEEMVASVSTQLEKNTILNKPYQSDSWTHFSPADTLHAVAWDVSFPMSFIRAGFLSTFNLTFIRLSASRYQGIFMENPKINKRPSV